MKNKNLLFFRVLTGILSVLVVLGASQYFLNHEMVKEMFASLHFPSYLIYPMGIAKISGILALWFSSSIRIKEWAYAGFVFNFLLAISAHLNVQDGDFFGGFLALILTIGSYFFYRKLQIVKD